MSDKPIAVGDLVMIVRCLNESMQIHLGKIGKVVAPHHKYPEYRKVDSALFDQNGVKCSWHIGDLKRLDPDALKDDVPTKEELTA